MGHPAQKQKELSSDHPSLEFFGGVICPYMSLIFLILDVMPLK